MLITEVLTIVLLVVRSGLAANLQALIGCVLLGYSNGVKWVKSQLNLANQCLINYPNTQS